MIHIVIDEKNEGSRIDKFLAKEFFSYSRREIAHFIKDGSITINTQRVKPSYSLKAGDGIAVNLPEKSEELFRNDEIDLDVLYGDVNIIVVNKPAGIQVHPSHTEQKRTLVNALVARFGEIIAVGDGGGTAAVRPGVVHRLDKDTSGVMVFARNQESFDALKAAFKSRQVSKKYLAITYGVPRDRQGIIQEALAKSSNYKKQIIANKKTKTIVREAVTDYRVIKEAGGCSLIEALPKTGRMHQIRVHLAYLGHPIMGDKIYGKRQILTQKYPAVTERQMLHASKLEFRLFGEDFSFCAPLPEDFVRCWEVLTKR